jgi:nucleoside-diphosphate-sugar epimerase
MSTNCIIGYTGFVGYNIINNNCKIHFDEFYNSKNIENIKHEYNIILFTGLSGNVGYVNANHEDDMENVKFFINKLKNIKCNKFILISTINVYPNLNSKMMEDEILELKDSIDYYGKHRLVFEKFIIENYIDHHILRLPSIYGERLKKGILYDLLHQNYLEGICIDDKLQFYDLSNLNEDIEYMCNNNIKILNLVSEPIYVKDIINNIFFDYKILNDSQIKYNDVVINTTKRPPKYLDICSKYFENGYMYNNNISTTKIKKFVESSNKLLVLIPLYKIKQHLMETNVNNNLFSCYENMFKISSESYLKHNKNIEIRVLKNDNGDEMNNFGDMFKDITKKILDIHLNEKRDILYVESDTICFDKINFENINKLLMFNLGTGNCDLYAESEMMNSGVIYLPKNYNINYDFTLELFNNCDFYTWINFERFWNILYHKQFTNFEESIKYNKYIGKYNFFKTSCIPNDFVMNIRSKDFFIETKPSIVHINGSRGAANCLNMMTHLKDLEITESASNIYEALPFLAR